MKTQLAHVVRTACLCITHLSHALMYTQLVYYTPQWCTYSLLMCTKFTCLLHILVMYSCTHSLSITHLSCVHTAYSCHKVHQCITHLSHVLTYTQLVYYTPQSCSDVHTAYSCTQSSLLVMYSCTHSLCITHLSHVLMYTQPVYCLCITHLRHVYVAHSCTHSLLMYTL